jgi:hypothetical protein
MPPLVEDGRHVLADVGRHEALRPRVREAAHVQHPATVDHVLLTVALALPTHGPQIAEALHAAGCLDCEPRGRGNNGGRTGCRGRVATAGHGGVYGCIMPGAARSASIRSWPGLHGGGTAAALHAWLCAVRPLLCVCQQFAVGES